MAVIDTYLLKGAANAVGFQDQGRAFNRKFTIDAAKVNIATTDVLKLMLIPLGLLIEDIIVNVLTIEDSTSVIDIGDYTTSDDVAVDADGYFDALDIENLGVSRSRAEGLVDGTPNVVRAYSRNGKYYADALRYLGVLVVGAANTAKFEVIVVGRNLNAF